MAIVYCKIVQKDDNTNVVISDLSGSDKRWCDMEFTGSDNGVMDRVISGDAAAFSELHDKWRPILFGRFLRKVKDVSKAEDLVQSTLLKVWEKRESFDSKAGEFCGWISRLAHNVLIDEYRSETRLRNKVKAIAELTEVGWSDNEVEDRDLAEAVRTEVASIGGDIGEAIALRLKGHSITEIMEITGVDRPCVKGRFRLGLERLRNSRLAEAA